MTTGMDWIGKRLDEAVAASKTEGRLSEREAIAVYLEGVLKNFQKPSVFNFPAFMTALIADIRKGEHL